MSLTKLLDRTDPFSLKSLPKWHPRRLLWTASARRRDSEARSQYERLTIPMKAIPGLPESPVVEWEDTAVTPVQLQHLLSALRDSEGLGGCVVEIGAFRGVTTRALSQNTKRPYFAVDPFQGWGGSEEDYAKFCGRTKGLGNFTHLRTTSGEASGKWAGPKVSMIFIDAVHDYANTSFDVATWHRHFAPGAFVALHDTDTPGFAGTRRAAYEWSQHTELYAHVENLTILRLRAG